MKNILSCIFIFFACLAEAKYSAEYNALVPEEQKPKQAPEWWRDGMGYKDWLWPQTSESTSCGKKGEEGYGNYHFYQDDSIFIKDSILFFNKLKDTLRKNDKKTFASMISYPMLWNIMHEYNLYYYIYLHTSDEVIYHYDAIMNKRTKDYILRSPPPEINPVNNLISINIGNGTIWLQCEMKIYVINNRDPNLKALHNFIKAHP